jgi:hypothetical protein
MGVISLTEPKKVGRPPSDKKNKALKATEKEWRSIVRLCQSIKKITKQEQSGIINDALFWYYNQLLKKNE